VVKKKDVQDGDLCAMGLNDPLERKVMARAMKAGEDQINLLRESQSKNEEPDSEESSKN